MGGQRKLVCAVESSDNLSWKPWFQAHEHRGLRFALLNNALGVLGKGSQGDEEALLEQGTWGG